jgi:CheY-like chemotaxis protein
LRHGADPRHRRRKPGAACDPRGAERQRAAVSLAVNGRDGLDRFRKAEFDLVVTDLIMPEMEGIET